MDIREEHSGEEDAIRALVADAFAGAAHGSGTEGAIVDALRAAGALTLSLVAMEGARVTGHVAFSPVAIAGVPGWFGLGPLAVAPERQRRGIGAALVRTGLDRLRRKGAAGCVVLGDPGYYSRFGFAHDPALTFTDVPPPYFQRLVLTGTAPAGPVAYHPAFGAG